MKTIPTSSKRQKPVKIKIKTNTKSGSMQFSKILSHWQMRESRNGKATARMTWFIDSFSFLWWNKMLLMTCSQKKFNLINLKKFKKLSKFTNRIQGSRNKKILENLRKVKKGKKQNKDSLRKDLKSYGIKYLWNSEIAIKNNSLKTKT